MNCRRCFLGGMVLVALLLGTRCPAADAAPAFRFGGRNFTKTEAEKIAQLPATPPLPANAGWQDKIAAQRELIGGIALFARDGVELSAEETLLALGGEMLLLEAPARMELNRKLAEQGLSLQEFCRQEAQDVRRQFAVAARKWYRRRFAGEDKISNAQVRDWYYRHQTRFLQEELNPEKCFVLESRDAVPTVLAMLAQGATVAELKQAAPLLPLPADTLLWLNNAPVKREKPASGYTLVYDDKRVILLQDGALQKSYRKLDAELRQAIEQALYDALARARLAAALTEELKDAEIEFLN